VATTLRPGSVTLRYVRQVRRRRTGLRRWALWALPSPAIRYILLIDAAALVGLIVVLARASWHWGDGLTALAIVACGVLSAEVFRRVGAPHRRLDRAMDDLTAAFIFPAALLLPPVYAALVPLPISLLLQARQTREPLMKWIFNTAVAVLISVAAAGAHDRLAAPMAAHRLSGSLRSPGPILAIFVAAFVYVVLNSVLVAGILRRVAPGTPLRTLLFDKETWTLAVADICAGVVVALVWVASPVLIVFALFPILLLQRAVVHTHLVMASRHDAKTGLANPSWWRSESARAVNRAQHGGERVAVVVIDLDHFKDVNDRHGHLLGDAVLAAVADSIRVIVRPGDLVGRFGGDEFTVLLAGIDEAQALSTAERLRERLATTLRQAVPPEGPGPSRLTASLGVAVFGHAGIDLDGLLAAADGAMYQAKALGGNNVCLAAAPERSPASRRQIRSI
jgi:diguanylate cyclase (GGDEF)-like protein